MVHSKHIFIGWWEQKQPLGGCFFKTSVLEISKNTEESKATARQSTSSKGAGKQHYLENKLLKRGFLGGLLIPIEVTVGC